MGGEKKRMNAVCRYIFSFEQLQPLPFRGEKNCSKADLRNEGVFFFFFFFSTLCGMLTENLISGGKDGKKRWCITKRVCAVIFFFSPAWIAKRGLSGWLWPLYSKRLSGAGGGLGRGGTRATHPSLRLRKY